MRVLIAEDDRGLREVLSRGLRENRYAGADDYLVKPFDFDELLARMRALQRRVGATRAPHLIVGDLRLAPATRQVWADGRQLQTVRGVGFRILGT